MGLVNHQQKILGKIINQSKGRLPRLTSCQMPGIVFDTGAIPHFIHHFQIIIGALLQALGLQNLEIMIEIIQSLSQLYANISHSPLQILPTSYIVRGRKDGHMVALSQHLTREHIKLKDAIHLVIKHFNAHGLFTIGRRNNLNDISPHPKGAALKIDIIAVVLNLYQLMQNFLSVNNLAQSQGKHHIIVLLGGTQAINTADAGHDNNISALKEGAGSGMAQLIDFIINGSILFNISIGLGNIGLRLVVIVIGNKVFHRIIREEGLQLTGQLCRQRFVVSND